MKYSGSVETNNIERKRKEKREKLKTFSPVNAVIFHVLVNMFFASE